MSETKVNSSLFSKFKKSPVSSFQNLPDITGLTLGDFHIDSRLNIVSGEADIYLCSGTGSFSGEKYLLKYYRRSNAVKPDVLEKLKTVCSPFVAHVDDYGTYHGHQYVIRPYYEMLTLSELLSEGTRFSEDDLKTLIIPSVIAGLKAVHDAGILHKGLKPANLIPDDTGEHIVLINFGISSDEGITTQNGMTHIYAAPEVIQGSFGKEADYYALGITIFELFTGFTPLLKPGLFSDGAAGPTSVNMIDFPDNFPEDLKKLVIGLTCHDINHSNEKDNPNRRWGYDEVRRWLNGEDVPVPGEGGAVGASLTEFASPSASLSVSGTPFQAYRFNGKTYTTEKALLSTMLEFPEKGLKDLKRGFLSHHYYAFSEDKGTLCADAEKMLPEKMPGTHQWADTRILYSLIYSLNPDVREIFFDGQLLGGIQDLGQAFIDAGTKEALQNHGLRGKSYPLTGAVKDFVLSGIPEDYASIVLKNAAVRELFSKTAALWKNKEHAESDTELALILGYSLCDDRRIPIGDKIYESPEVFRKEMADLVSKDRMAYMKLIETVRTDLDFLEKNLPDGASQEAIARSLDDLKYAVFGNDEYHFKDGQEFWSFIERLVSEEKPYEIRRLLNRYQTPLKQVSKEVWGTKSLKDLQKTVSGFISIGEYLFTGEKSFWEFMTGILERSRWDPAFILSFVKAHRDSLGRAATAFPGIKENVAALYAARDAVIVFDEELFPDLTAFKVFITDTIKRGNEDPDYLLEFVKRHRNAIDSLMKKQETEAVLKPLTELSDSFIVFDSRVFATETAFAAYLNDVIAAGKKNPAFFCRFVKNHSRELEDLRCDSRCNQILNALYDAENQLVCLDELVFRSAEEFRTFMEQLLNSGKENPAYLRRFVQKHEKALNSFSGDSVLSSVVAPVIAAGNSVIELDEYVFSDAAGFAGFVGDLNDKCRIADFVCEHKAGLEILKSSDALAPKVRELQDLDNYEEKGEAITVNGTRYSPKTMKKTEFKAGLATLKSADDLALAVQELQNPENSDENGEAITVNSIMHTQGFLSREIIKKGCYVRFGSYPQNDVGVKEPIEWLILEANDQEALLVSCYGLDCSEYHHESASITWENSDLREWLNNDFLMAAFSEEEQTWIRLADVVNDDNRTYRTRGGNNTRDRIFCLSFAEALRYFKNDSERRCPLTALAEAHGVHPSNDGYCRWWLRSPGRNRFNASCVGTDGAIYPGGDDVDHSGRAVRPALRIICSK